jgi:hypothetical protein
MPQPTTNNLEGWEFLKDKILADIGVIVMIIVMEGKNTNNVIKIINNLVYYVKQFISDTRKKDMEELIKRVEQRWITANDQFNFKQLIKDYYN